MLEWRDSEGRLELIQRQYNRKAERHGAAGVEPASEFDGNANSECGCDYCKGYGAALALHSRRTMRPEFAPFDADLQRLIAAWHTLPNAIRTAVLALVGTVVSQMEGSMSPVEHRRPDLEGTIWRLARECRQIVQGCLREEEWRDADSEFYSVIRNGLTEIWADLPHS
jgi:hypothetical protein